MFTEWDPTAESDLDALRSVFDSNGDGVFDANDAEFANFKVMVTNADGSTTAKTLAELGITSIDLTGDATLKELSDGSVVTSETTFTRTDGTTGTAADTQLTYERDNNRVEQVDSVDGAGVRTEVSTRYNADGSIDFEVTSITSADGSSVTNLWDKVGDGVVDFIQTIDTVVDGSGQTVATVTNKTGSDPATAIVENIVVTTTSADGLSPRSRLT